VLVGGGGAAGFNAVAIARRLGCPAIVMPSVGAVLSAAGALMSDLTAEYGGTCFTTSGDFDHERVNALLEDLAIRCRAFAEGPGASALEWSVELAAEARYPHQIWELEVPLRVERFASADDVEQLRQDFHGVHADVFAISDPASPIEVVGWRARVRCRLRERATPVVTTSASAGGEPRTRRAYFPELGEIDAPIVRLERMQHGRPLEGPVIVESPVTTVVVDKDASVVLTPSGSLSIDPSLRPRERVPEGAHA
jgi:N-methylhydantoinase A